MSRRLGLTLIMMVMALLVMTDGAWACRCMNGLINRCGYRRVCCGYCVEESCCQPVAPACCQPDCCQPACGEVKPPEAAKPALPATPTPAPVVSAPVLPTPAAPPAPKPEPKPEVKPVEKPAPVEVPAEPRVPAKPDIAPVEPLKPTEPAAPVPQAPQAPKPPDAPAKPKDDPFGNANNDVKTLRTWTDASGKYQVEARFVGVQDGTVRLQKANGRYVRVAFELLCSVDKDFVMNQDQSLYAME